jgi:hypothetical protein
MIIVLPGPLATAKATTGCRAPIAATARLVPPAPADRRPLGHHQAPVRPPHQYLVPRIRRTGVTSAVVAFQSP